jgi:hypothetical protein
MRADCQTAASGGAQINPRINPQADDNHALAADHDAMTTTDYLINGLFVLLVLRQARTRRLDTRSLVLPLVAVFFVAQNYIHTVPTAGSDLILIGTLAGAGLVLGTLSALATHVGVDGEGFPVARVGWVAGTLLVFGICSRMVFAFAVTHGAGADIRSFSIAHHLSAAAWPIALVSMAILEVSVRVVGVHLRGRRAAAVRPAATVPAGALA